MGDLQFHHIYDKGHDPLTISLDIVKPEDFPPAGCRVLRTTAVDARFRCMHCRDYPYEPELLMTLPSIWEHVLVWFVHLLGWYRVVLIFLTVTARLIRR